MAHIQDRWETIVDGKRVRTDRYGQGKRWRARYLDPAGNERSKTFARKQDAERFLTTVAADVLRGAYVDPDAGRITFAEFGSRWLDAQTFGASSREATELRLRLHACQHFGQRELRAIKPSVIQAWLRKLQQELAPSYVRTIFTNVSAVFSAAVDDGLIAANPCQAKSVRLPKRETEKVEPWTSAQVREVTDALPRRYRALAVVTAGCGLRQGEAFGLRVSDVDFLRRRVKVEQQVKLLGAGASRSTSRRAARAAPSRCRTPSPSRWPSTSAGTPHRATNWSSRRGSTGRSTATTSTATPGARRSRRPGSSGAAATACTHCATSTPRCSSTPASPSGPSPTTSATPIPASPSASTPTCSRPPRSERGRPSTGPWPTARTRQSTAAGEPLSVRQRPRRRPEATSRRCSHGPTTARATPRGAFPLVRALSRQMS